MMPQMTTPTWVEPPSVSKNTEVKVLEPASSNDAIAKPRIILQTTSEVDLLDDGESMARKLLKEILIQDKKCNMVSCSSYYRGFRCLNTYIRHPRPCDRSKWICYSCSCNYYKNCCR
ncbi:uncharacterized protein LOC114299868 isoform X5 [Camellia sinensis]|uniref:uncharacterized protein LOC114299868 isoform X5 n=1 Tax=Camellia sinensis TaxID=4442 RepID=UPI001036851C|nr:uncharacterized protein LOC114299868 isoform X5 [Camellia sinensis]